MGLYTTDDDPSFQWGVYAKIINPSAIATDIGSGMSNTAHIVSYHDALDPNYYLNGPSYYSDHTGEIPVSNDGTVAAKVCADYSITVHDVEYDDWFLPSNDEALEMNKVTTHWLKTNGLLASQKTA